MPIAKTLASWKTSRLRLFALFRHLAPNILHLPSTTNKDITDIIQHKTLKGFQRNLYRHHKKNNSSSYKHKHHRQSNMHCPPSQTPSPASRFTVCHANTRQTGWIQTLLPTPSVGNSAYQHS